MIDKLPEELQNIILDYAIPCKKSQNFYINKEITNYVCKKKKNCKCIHYFNIDICFGCNKKVLQQLHNMMYTIL
jgi:hypothetical protein